VDLPLPPRSGDPRYVCGLALTLPRRLSLLRRGDGNRIQDAYAFVLPAPALAAAAAALVLPGLAARSAAAVPKSPAKLLGQRVMVALPGTSASAGLLRRIRAGEVGAVILFARNIASDRQVRALTGALQGAARAGGNPPLLIAVDQEGGQVSRFANGPPSLSPPRIGASGSTKVAFNQGWLTGRYLRSRGVNMDLAPVVDVPTSSGAFIWREGRAFSFSASDVGKYATSFALGLQAAHVAATAKHFPGVGSATTNTDFRRDEVRPNATQRQATLRPYQSLIPRGLDAVMVATAGFPAYDTTGASAALSSPVIGGLLRGQLGFAGVAITDSLSSPTGHDEITAGVVAAQAGADVLLYVDSAPGELAALESALARGRITRAQAASSYGRIVALKRRLGS
jgi:beta-N-acetylhexosaminidase